MVHYCFLYRLLTILINTRVAGHLGSELLEHGVEACLVVPIMPRSGEMIIWWIRY